MVLFTIGFAKISLQHEIDDEATVADEGVGPADYVGAYFLYAFLILDFI